MTSSRDLNAQILTYLTLADEAEAACAAAIEAARVHLAAVSARAAALAAIGDIGDEPIVVRVADDVVAHVGKDSRGSLVVERCKLLRKAS